MNQETNEQSKEPRYESVYVQTDRRYRGGLYGVWDEKLGEHIALGGKGDMNKLADMLNKFGNFR